MSEPSRLDLLRFARRVVERNALRQLAELDQWIADEERRERETRLQEERRPPAPDWLLEVGIGAGSLPVQLHQGDCWNPGKRHRPVSVEQARRALAEQVPACGHCQPDVALGWVDG
ncbi:DUF6233 domain-containing protein [Streptomyces sp. NPDC007088]|uniref:DUF6233 domain-containing protein n=1 Tax=Streptomyces sp. NPDC007088 TaxID=3364773 RepID=UPI00369CC210